jgi:hypothetical protein
MTKPEFSRPLEVSRIPAKGGEERLTANQTECEALALRMHVPAIHAFHADLTVAQWRGGGVKVTGEVTVDLDQVSVVSLEPFRSTVRFDVRRYFSKGAAPEDGDADPIENGRSLPKPWVSNSIHIRAATTKFSKALSRTQTNKNAYHLSLRWPKNLHARVNSLKKRRILAVVDFGPCLMLRPLRHETDFAHVSDARLDD